MSMDHCCNDYVRRRTKHLPTHISPFHIAHKIPRGLDGNWTRASAVTGRRLAAWAMAGPLNASVSIVTRYGVNNYWSFVITHAHCYQDIQINAILVEASCTLATSRLLQCFKAIIAPSAWCERLQYHAICQPEVAAQHKSLNWLAFWGYKFQFDICLTVHHWYK